MKDVQSEKDLRNIPLKHVGIKGLRWPIELRDKARGTQHSVAEVTLAVDLPHDMRGTHMSRFVECLRTLGPVGLADVEAILDQLKQHLQAERAFIELKFPYFVTKKAPVSGMEAPMDIDCVYKAEKGEKLRWRITAVVPVQTLCPCSKESVSTVRITSAPGRSWRLRRRRWCGWRSWWNMPRLPQARRFMAF